jgi:hypothetical protein
VSDWADILPSGRCPDQRARMGLEIVVHRNYRSVMSEEQQHPREGLDYIDKIEASVGTNRDTKGLGAMRVGRCTVGSIDPINGEDGKEKPDFVPTLHELKQLASYWIDERIDHDFDWFAYQQTGSSEWRWSVFISRRLDRLTEILGEEAMQQVRKDAVASYRKRYPSINDEDWRVFTIGTDEEQEAWRTKLWKEMSSGTQQEGR